MKRANARWPAIIFCPKHPELSMGKMDKIEEDGLDHIRKERDIKMGDGEKVRFRRCEVRRFRRGKHYTVLR